MKTVLIGGYRDYMISLNFKIHTKNLGFVILHMPYIDLNSYTGWYGAIKGRNILYRLSIINQYKNV